MTGAISHFDQPDSCRKKRLDRGTTNAFTHDGTTFRVLPMLPGWLHCYGFSVNDTGVVAGHARRADGQWVIAVFENNAWRELGDMLGGKQAIARSINAFGRIVGTAINTCGQWRAFVYDFGRAHDINDLVPEEANGASAILCP